MVPWCPGAHKLLSCGNNTHLFLLLPLVVERQHLVVLFRRRILHTVIVQVVKDPVGEMHGSTGNEGAPLTLLQLAALASYRCSCLRLTNSTAGAAARRDGVRVYSCGCLDHATRVTQSLLIIGVFEELFFLLL